MVWLANYQFSDSYSKRRLRPPFFCACKIESMKTNLLMKFRRHAAVVLTLTALMAAGLAIPAWAQTPDAAAALVGKKAMPWGLVAADAALAQVDQEFAKMKLPMQTATLKSGNDIGMKFSSVSAAGRVPMVLTSAIDQTDAMWLLTLSPTPDAGLHLLASATFAGGTAAQITLSPRLYHTQSLLVVVRAGGQFYGLAREVKIAQAAGASKKAGAAP
jgi:hypothetical protein